MGDVLVRTARLGVRGLALLWLLVLAPLELASALGGLLSGPTVHPVVVGSVLMAARVAVAASGLMLGRRLLQRSADARGLAVGWALADLGTLAIVLASGVLPSNRAPGDEPVVWLGYAVAAGVVVVAARQAPRA